MHEMALCEGVLAVALEAAGDRPIAGVTVRVGQLQRVLPESWEMCWRMATMDSLAQDSQAKLKETPARIHCESCGAEGSPRPPLDCASCGSHSVRVIAGDDIQLEEIELVGGELLANPHLAAAREES